MKASEWFNLGEMFKIHDRELFVYDSAKHDIVLNKPVLLILHGFPTCCYDYYKALPFLQKHFRVIMHDHLGFGFSDKPKDYSYSLIDQTDYALQLWKHLNIKKAHVLAHDYGTSIATELLARHNKFAALGFNWESLTLCNGSMHVELAQLRPIQKLLLNKFTGPLVAKMSSKKTLKKNLKQIYVNDSLLEDEEVNALWEMMNHKGGQLIIAKTIKYINERYQFWHRWIGALKESDLAIHIVWAKQDKVAVVEMTEVIHNETKNSDLTLLDDLGHFPMMENPEIWSKAVIDAIGSTS